MIEYKNILLCSDFSEDANIAFLHAFDLAKKYNAKLHIIHVPHSSYAYCRHIVDEHVPKGAPGGEAFFGEEIEKAAEAALLKSAILLFCHPRYKLIIAANSDFSHIHQLQNVLKTKSLRV